MIFLIAFVTAIIATVRIPGLDESSALVASRRHPGVFWTMNDDSGPILFAFDRKGKLRARIHVPNAKNQDWEGLSLGPGPSAERSYLYIGDIGDNFKRRKFIMVYRIEEPEALKEGARTAVAFRFTYPDGPHDAEALLVHPGTGDLYIVTKTNGNAGVYKSKAPLHPGRLEKIAELSLPPGSFLTKIVGRITGGDIAPDGKRVILCDYDVGLEAVAHEGESFDEVWKRPWREVDLGRRQQGEGVAYRHDGKAILATSEGAEFPLTEVHVFRSGAVR
jgi:hypothetical protein